MRSDGTVGADAAGLISDQRTCVVGLSARVDPCGGVPTLPVCIINAAAVSRRGPGVYFNVY